MAELKNTFSWSFSAAHDFEECRRKRYWGKYAMWGGWDRNASDLQKKAYQLNKMDNIYSLQGRAAEEAVMWVLREKQAGRDATAARAYEEVARPLMNRSWKESKDGTWRASPKKFCCLREHYYKEWDAASEKERTAAVIEHTKRCIENFIARVLPRIQDVKPGDEIPVAGPGGGDPEHFDFSGVKIYAIPDYVYRKDGKIHIHDWKSGKVKESHRDQLGLYGLWAHAKHGAAPEDIFVYIEYLADGQVAVDQITAEELERIGQKIAESVSDMTDYLEDGDLARNTPVPREEWDLAAEPRICRRCNFYELCEPELQGLL